jgi:hypothetical protein
MTDHRPAPSQRLPRRLSRRAAIGSVLGVAATLGPLRTILAQGQDSTPESTPASAPIQSTTVGSLPTTGALRPGPVGQDSPPVQAANPTAPVTIQVDKAGINAGIETLDIVNGVMQNPTGPWVVAWYRQTATLGELGNVVLAGHVDYWNVGPSVFYNLRELVAGDFISLAGENATRYNYAVEWSETFDIDQLTSGKLAEVVGPTDTPATTLITCGGEFDYVNGEYLSRMVVRATLVETISTPQASTPVS